MGFKLKSSTFIHQDLAFALVDFYRGSCCVLRRTTVLTKLSLVRTLKVSSENQLYCFLGLNNESRKQYG